MSGRAEAKDYTVSLEEGCERYSAASERAMERVLELGIDVLEDRPLRKDGKYFDGRLPTNVNDLNINELGDLYGMMDKYANWLTGFTTVAKAEVTNAGEKLSLAKARIRKSKKGSKEERDDETICDSRYVEINAAWLEASEYHALLAGLLEAAARDLRVISRLVETKKVEFEQGRRGGYLDSSRPPSRLKRPRGTE